MSYQGLIEDVLDSLVGVLQGIQINSVPAFKTVAMTEPAKVNITRMPAAYVLLDKDIIVKKARYLELHTLQITISVVQVVKGSQHSDVDLEKGFHDGITLVGAVYDSLAANRKIDIKSVDYGRTPLDAGVVFWGELQLETEVRYAPGKPVDAQLIQEVGASGNIE